MAERALESKKHHFVCHVVLTLLSPHRLRLKCNRKQITVLYAEVLLSLIKTEIEEATGTLGSLLFWEHL